MEVPEGSEGLLPVRVTDGPQQFEYRVRFVGLKVSGDTAKVSGLRGLTEPLDVVALNR